MKRITTQFAIFCLLLAGTFAQAQNTFPSTGAAGIGTLTPASSSLLEVKSTSKGVLLPRMTKTQRDAIASPVEGLIVYQTTNTPGVYYFDGSLWKNVSKVKADLSNLSATSINESLLPNATGTLDLGSTTLKWRDAYLSNIKFADGTTLSTAAGGGGGIGGSGTTSYIPKFTSSSAIGNSSIYDNAGLIGIGTTVPASKLHALATDLTTITAENTSTSGTSPITGVKSLLTSAATNSKTAYFGNITSSTSNIGVIRGLDLDISQSGIGQTYGLDIDITGSGGSSKYGISSSLNTSSTSDIKYGCYISVTDAKLHTQPSYDYGLMYLVTEQVRSMAYMPTWVQAEPEFAMAFIPMQQGQRIMPVTF